MQLRGISLPILIRFGEILKHRLGEVHQAFQNAIAEHNYKSTYCCVYPIKVNQQRQVVEEVFEYGRKYKFGLEAGSKPELLAVLAIADNETPIICNGFKDDEYIEMVMLAKKIGRQIIPVVEKYTELDLILKHSARVGVRPVIGLRIKLASRGSGRWKSSGGYRSKFGLTVTEALRALEQLKALGMEDCLQLLHFHLGSQITNIRQIKAAVIEAARAYVEMRRSGAGLNYLDVGGGWVSTTTAHKRILNPASTTRCRNTPTISCITSRACATKPRCRIRPSFPRADARWWRITACWCSTSWA